MENSLAKIVSYNIHKKWWIKKKRRKHTQFCSWKVADLHSATSSSHPSFLLPTVICKKKEAFCIYKGQLCYQRLPDLTDSCTHTGQGQISKIWEIEWSLCKVRQSRLHKEVLEPNTRVVESLSQEGTSVGPGRRERCEETLGVEIGVAHFA